MTRPAHHSKYETFQIYDDDVADRRERLAYPHENATEEITRAFARLKEDGAFVALVDGAFDVPHPNHEWYLRHCRSLGGAALLENQKQEPTPDKIREAIGSDAVKLAVTVDADYKINYKKSGKSEKGGVQRPIYPWEARAGRIAGYTFKAANGLYRPVVDLVTVEGDEIHEDTALESSLTLASHLHDEGLLDTLIIYGEHTATIEEAHAVGIDPIIIPNATDYVINPQTGRAYSSSEIISRAQGATVSTPITRPLAPAGELLPS